MEGKAIAPLHKFVTAQSDRGSDPRVLFWYSLSLLLALYYGYLVLQSAFSAPFVVQDDARQHVFWMLRFLDPALLPDDFMADYFQENAPAGYTWLYRTVAELGLHPFTFNKILPPILGLLGTHYAFQFSLQLLPVPAVAFTSTLLLNQSLWMRDDLVSGTPRAFFYILLLAFLVYVNQRAIAPCLVVLALQPLFYPHCALLSAGILLIRLCHFEGGKLYVTADSREYWLSGLGLGLLVALLLPYALHDSAFGPLITPAEARHLPEFLPGGRAAYFTNNPILFWFGDRSGFIPTPVLTPPMLAFSLFFPWLWGRSRHPWMQTIRAQAGILQQLVIVSFGLYFLAHLVLFQLHLPSRYTHHSLRIVFALAASFTIALCLDALLRFLMGARGRSRHHRLRRGLAVAAVVLIVTGLFGYSALTQSFPFTNNRVGTVPELYRFLQTTPTDTVIASLTKETSNLQTFAQRSPLIAPELGLPYHQGYYAQFRQRTVDLIAAQYSPNPQEVGRFIEQYGVNYWLVDDQSFSAEHWRDNDWFQQYQPIAAQAIATLADGNEKPFVQRAIASCTILETVADLPPTDKEAQHFWLLDAQCLQSLPPAKSPSPPLESL